jgi:hypothetical protein
MATKRCGLPNCGICEGRIHPPGRSEKDLDRFCRNFARRLGTTVADVHQKILASLPDSGVPLDPDFVRGSIKVGFTDYADYDPAWLARHNIPRPYRLH